MNSLIKSENRIAALSLISLSALLIPFFSAGADCLGDYKAMVSKSSDQILKDQQGVKAVDGTYKKYRHEISKYAASGAAIGFAAGFSTDSKVCAAIKTLFSKYVSV